MHGADSVQVSVEAPTPQIRLLRVAGRLDRAASSSVSRLIAAQLDLLAGQHCAVTDLLVDIAAVASFTPEGVAALHDDADRAARRGVGLSVSGCGGRVRLLPLAVLRQLSRLQTFPTAGTALRALTGHHPLGEASSARTTPDPGSAIRRPRAPTWSRRVDLATPTRRAAHGSTAHVRVSGQG